MTKGRILIVSEDIDIARMLHIYFAAHGYEVLISQQGSDALDLCRTQSPAAVLLDAQLPGVADWPAHLPGHALTQSIPVIQLTPNDDWHDGRLASVDDFVSKPFDLEELKYRLEAAMECSRGS